jgi:hypothetical protein
VTTACASVGTVRPPFQPLYQAFVDTVRVDGSDWTGELERRNIDGRLDDRDTLLIEMAELIGELEQRSIEEGLAVRVASVLDGYLETRWFDVVSKQSSDREVAHPEREILLRFWIDPVGPLGYKLSAEAVYRRVADPSLSSRAREVMVPPGHEGEAILVRILNGVRGRFNG